MKTTTIQWFAIGILSILVVFLSCSFWGLSYRVDRVEQIQRVEEKTIALHTEQIDTLKVLNLVTYKDLDRSYLKLDKHLEKIDSTLTRILVAQKSK